MKLRTWHLWLCVLQPRMWIIADATVRTRVFGATANHTLPIGRHALASGSA